MSLRTRPCAKCGARFYADITSKAKVCQHCDGSHDRTKQAAADKALMAKSMAGRNTTVPQSMDPRSPKGEATLAALQAPPATRAARSPRKDTVDTAPVIATAAAQGPQQPAGVPGA